jgi:two-component system KDP operon response regulator KdpE
MNPNPAILMVEDDDAIRSVLATTLTHAGHRPITAHDLASGLTEAQSRQPELILLDLGLPDGDGLTLIPKLRGFTQAPILILSARGQEQDRIAALDLGADDFIPKPFTTGELLARIRACLRRSHRFQTSHTYRFADVEVDLEKRSVQRAGALVHLTPTEFRLLQLFIENEGTLLTQRTLLNAVWGPQSLDQSQYLRVYMKQLRQKLEHDPARPKHFKTETGIGYRFLNTTRS